MSVSLMGLPVEITADHKFLIVDSESSANVAREKFKTYTLLYPSQPFSLEDIEIEAWLPLKGHEVVCWPTNGLHMQGAMQAVANILTRLTDRLRIVHVNGVDVAGISASQMADWEAPLVQQWIKDRVKPYQYVEPNPQSDYAASIGDPDDPSPAVEREANRKANFDAAEEPSPVLTRNPIKWRELEGQTPPVRPWFINHWLTYGTTLLAGRGGDGKTHISQTLATALALGKHYIDVISEPKRVLFWACEDDRDELWRRQVDITRYFKSSFDQLDNLIIEPRVGMDNSLFIHRSGVGDWLPLYDNLREQVNDYQADVVILDNIAQIYGGEENNRNHVTSFLSGLLRLTDRQISILLLGHPAKAKESEYSGSTAWEAAVRMRWYLGRQLPDKEDDEDSKNTDDAVRYLCKRKSNYSRLDYRELTYVDGVYSCPESQGERGPTFAEKYAGGARRDFLDAMVLEAVSQFVASGIRVVDQKNSRDSVVKRIRELKMAKDATNQELHEAVSRLRLSKKLVEQEVGKSSNRMPKYGLAPAQF